MDGRIPRSDAPAPIAAADVRDHLDRLVNSAGFRVAPRLQAFIRFVVEHSLADRDSEIKESSVGVEVYGKQPGYDPRTDSTVRVEASKLRQRLAAYYEEEGAAEQLRISIPKGGYIAKIDRLAPVQAAPPRPGISPLWAAAALAALGALAWWFWPASGQEKIDPRSIRITRLTAASALSTDPAVSPNGDFVVFASDLGASSSLDLWKQSLDGGPPVRLTESPSTHTSPTIGRDGSIVFRTSQDGGVLAILDPGASAPRILKNTARARDPRFAPFGQLLAYWVPADEETGDYGSVFVQDLADPRVTPVRLFGGFAHATRPVWHDSGASLVAAGTWRPEVREFEFDAWVVGLSGSHPAGTPVKTGLFPLLASTGLYTTLTERRLIEIGDWRGNWLYFSVPSGEAKDLYRVHLNPSSGQVSGQPQRLTLGSATVTGPRLASGGLVFAETETSADLYSLSEPALNQPAADLRKHTSETGAHLRHALDPAACGMVWERRQSGLVDQIWYYSLPALLGKQLAASLNKNTSHALLSPDGRSAAYRVEIPNTQPIYTEAIGSGQPRRACENCGTPSDWSPDGSHIWYITGGQPARIGLLDLKSGRNADSLAHPSYSLFGARQRVNARGDGWLAFYVDNGPRTRQIYVAPLRSYLPGEPDSWVAATTGATWDLSPAWSTDGNLLYFVSRRDGFACIMAQSLDPVSRRPVGSPWTVYHFHEPAQTLMRTRSNRGVDALWVAGGRIFFMLDRTTSSLRLMSGLKP